jgi:hypothetical protein
MCLDLLLHRYFALKKRLPEDVKESIKPQYLPGENEETSVTIKSGAYF